MWTGLEKAAVYGIGLAQSVALARLLRPADFGLAAMLGVFLNIGETLAESGLGTALVVLGKPGKEVERAALKWNLGIAAGLYALLCAGSWPISRFYGEPVLVPLLCVMALGLLAHAASVVALARLTREMAFGRLAWVHACSTLCAGGVAVLCAWRGGGVWSIAALTLVMACVRTALAWWFAGPKGEDGAASGARAACAFRPTLRLGLAFMASGLVWNVYVNLSQLIIGKLYSPAAVGLFVRGQRWATMPGEVVNESVARVALPTLSRARAAGERAAGRAFLALNCALLWPGLAVLWIWGHEIVGLVLGEAWVACVPYMRVMIWGAALTAVSSLVLTDIKARGAGKALLRTDLFKKPVGVAAVALGAFWGIEGLAWAFVVGQLAEVLADVWVWKRLK